MIIAPDRKFLFAAFNKTASTSIAAALAPYASATAQRELRARYEWLHPGAAVFKHARPLHLRHLLGEARWEDYFTFAFVRNPWSRIVSLYENHRRRPERWPLAQKSFSDWLLAGGTGSVRRSMREFVCDDEGNVIVTFIGRYERLEDDFSRACAAAGLPRVDLPHENRSAPVVDYRRYYDDETRSVVARLARADIEMFGYEFSLDRGSR